MSRRWTAVILSITMAVVFLALSAGAVVSDPVQDKKNELENIKNEVQRIDAQLEVVTEQYNLTNLRVQQVREAIAAKEQEIAALNATLQERRDILGERIRELYKTGNSDVIEVITECKTMDDLFVNIDNITRISGNDVDIIASVLQTRQEVEAAMAEVQARKAELDAAQAELASQKSQIESELQRRRELMAGVEAEVNQLIAQEQANRPPAPGRPSVPRSSTPPPPPPPYAPTVVQIAYQQLGKPYQYAGSGPNVFDCSGLIMYCYAQVGVRLPHSSYMQSRCGVRVSYAELQPGDLVFFHGYGHVGMYVGGGQYIHAPHTGDVVRVADLGRRRDFCGACRITY